MPAGARTTSAKEFRRSLAAKILTFQVVGLLAVLSMVAVYQYRSFQENVYREALRVADTIAQMIESLIVQNPDVLGTGELWGLLQVAAKVQGESETVRAALPVKLGK